MVAMLFRTRFVRRHGAISALVLLLFAGATLHAGLRHRVKVWDRCGIPCEYDYQAVRTSPPARAVSATAILLQSTPPAGANGAARAATEIQFFQLAQTRLSVDHCVISRVAVWIQPDGRWRVSLQGDQNPPGLQAFQPDGSLKQTAHLKRNEFYVVLRGYGASKLAESPGVALGKPLLFRIELAPFWVQNGIPRDLMFDGTSGDVQKFYDLVDRVEIDFSYR